MNMRREGIALTTLLALGACAVAPPSQPTLTAFPGNGKSLEQFRADDGGCRQYAYAQSGGAQAAQAATNNAVGTAAIGTALGAAAGALIGSAGGAVGGGAAVGAGLGLLGGSAFGASNAQASAGNLQYRYDQAYAQCMYSKGNTVQTAAAVAPPPYAYPYYRPYYYYPTPWGY